jgi:signal transduction histidine kinase
MSSVPDPQPQADELPRATRDAELEAIVALLHQRANDPKTGGPEAAELADRLEAAATRLAEDSDALKRRLLASLSVNHDINNALVGVVGNAQLLGLGPAAALPGVKERLEVIARESNRIKQATLKLSELKQALLIEGRTQGRGA